MGADKPEPRPTDISPKTNVLAFIKVSILLVALALPAALYFAAESASPKIKPQEEARLQKRLREIDDSEQYALMAEAEGWYPCLHSGRTSYYLKAGEVWKYGVTSKGKFGRYSVAFLNKHGVFYVPEFKGTFSECLKQEQIKLFNYPYIPENLARPPADRLRRPPYNPIMR